ncbi:MAG: endonuclease/exonuclease/phosphatase family protein [Oscillospiraceae bacterium]|nr:endonuclease/exonuclease/phosphatase family protein [Oscillospiraceae bacterium]
MKQKISKGILSVLAGLLALLLLALVITGWYFPRYLRLKETVQMQPKAGSITMMSCNVRCLTPMDLGKKSWYYRADLLMDAIASQMPGIIGFQEATCWQYQYLVDVLPGYDSVIDYRDTSVISEGCPIFYNEALYTLKEKGSFWLSETPDVMSKDWGAAHYRICSYVILTDKATNIDFVVFNTHLDHVSDEARIQGIGVVLEKIAQFGGLPAVIMGDFNALEGSKTYESATAHFLDAQYAAADTMQGHTYQNWGNPEKYKRLDYFMISKIGWTAQRYAVVQPVYDGVYASDHCPIVLELVLE